MSEDRTPNPERKPFTGKRFVTVKPYADSATWKVYDKFSRQYSEESYTNRTDARRAADDLNYLYT